MGACSSAPAHILEGKNDGDQEAYAARFKEDRVLGEGEFGQVKLVYEKSTDGKEAPLKSYACKTLRKGAVFKDNTLYPPIPPEVLMTEVEILRTLNGQYYCMKLVAIYETAKALLMVTDCYTGGEMMEYLSKLKDDLRTEDISKLSFQLLSAVNHCAKNNIIHRDIKAENVMFESEAADAEMRLIDFGCSTNKVVEGLHTTFAGTPFYNSPEMFNHKYTKLTDVWSAGVLLYVLVAGYPAEHLQRAFNKLLDPKRKSTKELTDMPDEMPDSYYEMLDELLKYSYKNRKAASEVLKMDFVIFHKDLQEEEQDQVSERLEKPTPRRSRLSKTPSVAILGSVKRHSAHLSFKMFERSLTTCLATMLDNGEIVQLLSIIQERYGSSTGGGQNPKLEVVLVSQLKQILKTELNNPACVDIVMNMPNSVTYDRFAYHTELLKEFAPNDENISPQGGGEGNRNYKLQKRASAFSMSSPPGGKNTKGVTRIDDEDNFNIGISLHGKVPSVTTKRGGGRMARAKSVAIGM